ncbi:hypothetical protein [Herbaspirillum sp. YR522]|uniref:hypothetical protein n=1 Tax=Herbaspirillum sp. YR522 TaxID=1144342 RepID=UPI00026F5CC7|nr:hypothetical protein [Herbaspirillum sp. YR522]EJN01756.1 hypothetical protein PMI40_03243 [Herbaspirillum sp. YR522]
MPRFRVTYQPMDQAAPLQVEFEVEQDGIHCDIVLSSLGRHIDPLQPWPFVVAPHPMERDADLAERAVRLARTMGAMKYLKMSFVSYLMEGKAYEVVC